MFWFVFIFALFVYGMCHLVYSYRIKAVAAGESRIGLFKPSELPFCRKCKICLFITFVFTLFTAFIVAFSGGSPDDWSFLALHHKDWEEIHVIVAVFFAVVLVTHSYIHAESIAAGFKRLLHIKK